MELITLALSLLDGNLHDRTPIFLVGWGSTTIALAGDGVGGVRLIMGVRVPGLRTYHVAIQIPTLAKVGYSVSCFIGGTCFTVIMERPNALGGIGGSEVASAVRISVPPEGVHIPMAREQGLQVVIAPLRVSAKGIAYAADCGH